MTDYHCDHWLECQHGEVLECMLKAMTHTENIVARQIMSE
jgi:hypothetical protein